MPQFALLCLDKPDSLPVRLAAREAHLAYLAGYAQEVRLAGPLLDDKGDPAGSLIVLEAPDIAAARALSAGDPYTLAGLFQKVDIHPLRITLGPLA